ncbi:hypothetical protein WG66_001059, partial [Moniliophthora roreri]
MTYPPEPQEVAQTDSFGPLAAYTPHFRISLMHKRGVQTMFIPFSSVRIKHLVMFLLGCIYSSHCALFLPSQGTNAIGQLNRLTEEVSSLSTAQ